MEAKKPILSPLNDYNGEDVSFHRSGSAPPTVEGSLNAVNDLNLGEFGNDPDYLSYYYNSGNRNPRMPPPVLSKEDWRSMQRLGGFGDNIGSGRIFEGNFSNNFNGEWVSGGDGLLGLSLGRQKSLAEILQDDSCHFTSNLNSPSSSRSASQYSQTCYPTRNDRYETSETYSSVVTPTFPGINRNSYRPIGSLESENLVSAFRGLNLSSGVSQIDSQLTFLHGLRTVQGQASRSLNQAHSSNSNFSSLSSSYFPKPSVTFSSDLSRGYPSSYLPPLFEHAANGSSYATSSSNRNVMDPLYAQYLRIVEFTKSAQEPSPRPNEHAYVDSLRASQYDAHLLGNNGYNSNTVYSLNPGRPTEQNLHFNPGTNNTHGGGVMGIRTRCVNGNLVKGFPFALLEELKNNKNVCIELSDIIGFVKEFSTDQFGSRFIQQKLETATVEEKYMLFKEIIEIALSLITDVFGNYVIQKFFEHGSPQQIRELADKLYTRVLDLSLHMYGCRVIQKAVEILDFEQQVKLVSELEGHVLMCVIDQNGNHVIQKCIEFVPEKAIQFIITSFYGNIATLSTHAYGCRVVQRVLEHCSDPKTLKIVMDEILKCICKLALDPFGNYVVQHILEHGKPKERSEIIKKLAGQIVEMSQQKFASNVVEKCFTFGGPADRKILIAQMLGNTDENAPLQAMMKDQFGNYVVQKVLETCDNKQRELILSRIKVHLSTLKKYTYGKHIVTRAEKLVAAGERSRGQFCYSVKMA